MAIMSQRYARITGWGKYVPVRVVTNDDLAKIVETSDEWISSRTGIRERHIRAENDTTSSMGAAAGREALASAGLTPADLDLILRRIICCLPSPARFRTCWARTVARLRWWRAALAGSTRWRPRASSSRQARTTACW